MTDVSSHRAVLIDGTAELALRMRALWALRDIGTDEAMEAVGAALLDPSALLRHELCYVMGQARKSSAVPMLSQVLEKDTDCMVRHEAAEALGAIGSADSVPILQRFVTDPAPEVSETSAVSLDRIRWFQEHPEMDPASLDKFASVDPAPPAHEPFTTAMLKERLLDSKLSTFERYRALFALRNINDVEACEAVCAALNTGTDLFRHEIAFVLGQMENPVAAPALEKVLADKTAHDMVRHEAAEALGSICSDESLPLLKSYLADEAPAVRESCEVAMDMHDYWSAFKANVRPGADDDSAAA